MSEKPTLSINVNLSPEMQNKLQQLAGKPSTTKSKAPNKINTNVKAGNTNTHRPHKPKLTQEELKKKQKAVELHKQLKEQAIALYNQHLSYFSNLYPNCFSQTPKPLAIGIDKAIIADEAKKPEEEQIKSKGIKAFPW